MQFFLSPPARIAYISETAQTSDLKELITQLWCQKQHILSRNPSISLTTRHVFAMLGSVLFYGRAGAFHPHISGKDTAGNVSLLGQ